MSMVNPQPCCPGGPGFGIVPQLIYSSSGKHSADEATRVQSYLDEAQALWEQMYSPAQVSLIQSLNDQYDAGLRDSPAPPTAPVGYTGSWAQFQAEYIVPPRMDDSAYQLRSAEYAAAWTPPSPDTPARYLIDGVEQYADGTPVPGGYNAHDDAVRQLADQGYPNPTVAPDGTVLDPGVPAGPAATGDPTVTSPLFAGVSGSGALAVLAVAAIAGAVLRKR